MPKILETDIGEIEFPDEFTVDQLNEWGRNELPNLRERVRKGVFPDLASRFPRDVATAGADTIMGAARGAQLLRDFTEVYNLQQAGAKAAMAAPVGEEHAAWTAGHDAANAKAKELSDTREQRLAVNPVYQFGAESKKNAQEFYQTNPTLESSIPAMLSQGVASTVPVVAAGVFGPLAPAAAIVTYGAQSGEQGAQEAIQMGHPEKADEAYLAYAGLGAISEAMLGYPVALLKKVAAARKAGVDPVAFGQSVKTSLSEIGKKIGKEVAEGFGREAVQEGSEQIGQNVAAQMIGFDPNRELTKDVVQSFLVGGAVGGLFGGVGGGAHIIDEQSQKGRMARVFDQTGNLLDLRSIEERAPGLADQAALAGLSPQAAQRTVVPAMLQPNLVNVPGEIQPGVVSPVQPTPEQTAAEEAAAVAAIQKKQGIPSPAPAQPAPEAPKRRSIVPAPESPFFRPPMSIPSPSIEEPKLDIPSEKTQLGYTPPLSTGQPITFKTSKGSVYQFDGNSTVRDKSYHPEHGAEDVGLKTKSDLTVFLDDEAANDIGMLMESTGGNVVKKQIVVKDGKVYVVSKNKDGRFGTWPNSIYNIKTTPEIGLTPLELWRKEDGGQTHHFGNKITEISTGQPEAPVAPPATVPPEAPQKGVAPVAPSSIQARFYENQKDYDSGSITHEEYAKKQTQITADALQEIDRRLGIAPTTTGEPNAIITGKDKPVTQREGAGGQVEVNRPNRNVAPVVQEAGNPPSGGNQLLGAQGAEIQTPQAQGTVEPEKKAAEEQFEANLVSRAAQLVKQSETPEEAYEALVKLYAEMPRLGTRTAQSKTAQAYSTPPPLAFLAARLADLESGRTIAEPTAGNGMLLIHTSSTATLLANELDPNRNARLKQIFPPAQMSMLDATSPEFHDYLSQWQPDRLIMNPPFGGRVEEGGQAKQRFPLINPATSKSETPSIDLAIALNSLEAMAPNGRAVIIIGSKTGTMGPQFSPNDANRAKDYNRPEMLEFFQRFNVTDWFTVAGKLYEKMGAGWPVDVIVINGKRGTLPTAQGGFPRPWVKPPKVYNSWAELKQKLYETPSAVQPGPEQQPSATPAPSPRLQPGREPSGATGEPSSPPLPQPAATKPGRTSVPTGQARTPPAAPVQPRLPEREVPPVEAGGPAVVPASRPEPAPISPAPPLETGLGQRESARGISLGEGSNLLNVPFQPVSKLGGANLVAPSNLSDSMARAVETLEKETGKSVDDYVAEKLGWTKKELAERFSAAQAEAVGLFIRNVEQRSTGLINSDQTGVGKGRTVSAVIQYALKNGKIPVFVTASKQLYSDMAGRDLPAIGIKDFTPFITDSDVTWTNGAGEEVIAKPGASDQREAMAQIARTGKLPAGTRGIFTTYYQLKVDKPQGWKEAPNQKAKRKKKFEPAPDGPRLSMLRALAPNAIFILDEAHQAAGQDSDVGLSLQSILQKAAGVYYASATFAKRPDNLSLYALGTAMKKAGLTREQLNEVFTAGGVPLQQALSSMLTESGEFVRREQNMKGVDFHFESTGTDPEKEAELADTYTSYLRDLFRLSEQVQSAASDIVDSDNQVRGEGDEVDLASTTFGSRLFNLSSQYLFSLRSDATVQKAVAALKSGEKPFIAVYNTMAGPIADLQKRGLPLSFGGMLEREMQKMLEIMVKDPLAPGDPAKKVPKGKRLVILTPEELPDGGRYYYQLRDQIRSTDFSQMPISPIDTIKSAIKKAGYTIGELTGRPGEVEEGNESTRITKREKLNRNKVLSDFNNGGLDALIVNSSADTGVSAHTDPRFKDQRQRHMIIAQPNPDINGFMQIVGRVMRFGQTKIPKYTIIGSSLATERRFNTMLRAKLNSLNANTTADTESTITKGGLTADIFNSIGDEVVANVMAQNPDLAQLALVDPPDPENPEALDGYARRATGKFVLLPNADAEQLWREIAETYTATIKALDDAGENPLKADVVDLRAKTSKSQTIQEGTGKTLFDGPVVLETADVKPPQPALTGQQALDMAVQGREAAEGHAQDWLDKYAGAREKRIAAMRQRESTDAQIDATMQNFQRTRDAVEHALRLLGEPVAVMSTTGEGVDFYAVPIGLMLKSDNIGDFSGASKHSLVLATNSMRRQITLPLSQLPRVEQASIEAFDSERDQSGVRHIVTGNLLRGVQDATKMSRGSSRPKVTIYSTSDNQVKIGILMAPGWRPEIGLRALGTVLKNSQELNTAIATNKLITAGPVLIRGNSFSVPSRNEFRAIWGDPQFSRLFESSPIERKGEFAGELSQAGRTLLFDFLRSKGLTPTLQAAAEGGKLSVTLSEPTTATGVTRADIESAFPSEQGFSVKQVALDWTDGQPAVGYLVQLPNGQIIVIDPSHDYISFDPKKAAADWGFDEQELAKFGVARAKWTPGGVKIDGLDVAGIIDLLKTSGPDTLSHDKFHPLFQLALTEPERQAILNRYGTEEKAAEAFRRSEGFTRSFWDKIKRFLEWLANLFRGDAFKKLKSKLSPTFRSEPTGREKLSLQKTLASEKSLREFTDKPTVSTEEAASLKRQAGAGAGLVPDAIAHEVASLNPADPIEKRMAGLLDFVVKLHGAAPALELQRILADPNIPEDTKQASISNVLLQIENVRAQTDALESKSEEANANLAGLIKNGEKITAKALVEGKAKVIADNLITGYRAYLTAQAASLPTNQNVAATRAELINRTNATLTREQKQSPDQMILAIQAIAARIGELPVNEGPQAVADAIRQKGILRGVVGETTIDLLTAEKPGGLPPLLLNPDVNEQLRALADLQKKADTYAKQIEVVEQAFRGKGDLTPVELKKFADTYRKFRNKQADAAKAIAEHDKDFRKADEDVQVYGRATDVLKRLQDSPQFQEQFDAALNRPGGYILKDIYQTGEARKGDPTQEKVYISPLKQENAEGKEVQNTFRIHLAPDLKADNATIEDLDKLVQEIDRFLGGENGPVDPIEARTWQQRKEEIQTYFLHSKFLRENAGSNWNNIFRWGQVFFGGFSSSLRAEMEATGLRAADQVDREVKASEQASIGYRLLSNNKEIGDAATDVAVINAIKSHKLDPTDAAKRAYWNQYVLNPIIAAGQAAGQMRLKKGDYVPGTNLQITEEDMTVARMQKRWSSGVVQTTQGTTKGAPGILRNNPVLIVDTFSGKPVLRGALSPGPLTMARSYSAWGRRFDVEWAAAKTPEEQRALVNDGENFQMAALGFVRTTNPEFENRSPLVKVYEPYTANAKENPQLAVNSLDQLVDELADIAVAQNLFPTKEEATPQIESILMADIAKHVQAIRAQFAEDKVSSDVPQAVMQYASSQSAFTQPRKRMVAPDPYYDYTLTNESDRISFLGAGLQQFQLRIISSMEALSTALGLQQSKWDSEISNLSKHGGMTEKKAQQVVQKRTEKQLKTIRFSYEQLIDHRNRLEKMIKQMKELVIDVRNPNDALVLKALGRFHSLLSSGLLANPTAIANNLAGGMVSAKAVTLRNLGHAASFWNPKAHARMLMAPVKKLLRIFPGDTNIGKLARSNMPVVKDMAGWLNDMLLDQIKLEQDAEQWGLTSKPDLANTLEARGELKRSAGQIDYGSPGAFSGAINALGSLWGVRHATGALRHAIPRWFDEYMNRNNARFYQDTLFKSLKVRAIQAFQAREEIAARTGVDINELNDFKNEQNLLSPQELNLPKWSGFRDSGRLRQLFSTVGSLDNFLLDYYNRWKAAPDAEKANVPLFPDSADEGAVIHDIESHENIATAGFTPLSMQGVGQRGLIKKILFMFKNYPTRLFTQMARMQAYDERDPKVKRALYGWWSVLAILIISAVAGMLGREVSAPIQQALTGRSPSAVRLSNVLANPDIGMLSRYVGMALAGNLPYYGGAISQILGNPGHGSLFDVADYIPAAGLIKDAALAVTRTAQTGDPIFPAVDFISRWFPPASPALRLIPGVEGDIERQNAARALRVVGPSAGIELAGGGSGQTTQTPTTAAIRRLISAAYSGDAAGIQKAFDAAVAEKAAQGNPDPEKAVLQALASKEPARSVYGRAITPEEEAKVVGLMSGAQRADYQKARDAFALINQTLGTKYQLTSTPRARGQPGQATRRSPFGASASVFGQRPSRLRILGRRRSPFGHLTIRGATQRKSKRRSPARFSLAA